MSLLHGELLHAEVDSRLERAREARFKDGVNSLRRWARRAERAQIGLERARVLEREQPAAAPASGFAPTVLARPGDHVPDWA